MGTVIRVSGFSIWLDLNPKKSTWITSVEKVPVPVVREVQVVREVVRERVRVVVVQSPPVVIDGRFRGRVSKSSGSTRTSVTSRRSSGSFGNTGEDLEPGVGEEDSGLNAAFEEKAAIGIRRSARNK